MSNFDFLKSYKRTVARAAEDAQKILYISPEACAGNLRFVASSMAADTANKLRLSPVQDEHGNVSFHSNLIAIQKSRVASKEILDKFFDIKNSGNNGVHDYSGNTEDAKELLKSTYDIGGWFMREIKHSNEPIASFVMPEPSDAEPVVDTERSLSPMWKKFFSTRTGKWVLGVLAALGFAFVGQMIKGDSWDVALRNTLRIVVFVSVLALLAIPVFVFANGLSIWQAYQVFVSSIAEKLGWSEYLIDTLGLALLMPFFYSVGLVFSSSSSRRAAGFAALILMAIGYNLMFYYATEDTPFLFGSGRGTKYYDRTDKGIRVYDRAGYSLETGKPLLPITPDVWREYTIMKTRGNAQIVAVDPTSIGWFNSNDSLPMLWYSRDPSSKLEFYKQPGFNPNTGEALLPVTHELYVSWFASRQPKVQKPITQQEVLRSILHPAAFGGSGIMLVGQTAEGRGGAEALSRHVSGLNTSAFSAPELGRRGYASRFQGEPGLVREALSITHLNSLVVVEVKSECAKRSSLDSDMLSCDLTASVRKFDAHGNQSGSQMVQATGAGFNQEAAIDAAAQRAGSRLVAFAKQ